MNRSVSMPLLTVALPPTAENSLPRPRKRLSCSLGQVRKPLPLLVENAPVAVQRALVAQNQGGNQENAVAVQQVAGGGQAPAVVGRPIMRLNNEIMVCKCICFGCFT